MRIISIHKTAPLKRGAVCVVNALPADGAVLALAAASEAAETAEASGVPGAMADAAETTTKCMVFA